MWRELATHLPTFASAVLTGLDEQGYPFSVRCQAAIDRAAGVLRVQVGPGVPLQPGPAGLLCHRHDQWLWKQKSLLLRGTLEQASDGWRFRPVQLIPGAGIGGLRGLIGFVVGSRRAAARYLAARGLARPRIPWDDINAIKAQVKQASRDRRA
jgi:hypothetical protein